MGNLLKAQQVLHQFCIDSRALIYWDKSMTIWIGQGEHLNWMPHPSFKWTPRGEPI
jgi:hypothetical protein